ncbi:MAG: VOC family protein [Halioglobus sp.]|nr:VOC family protein [Halioglobus sp.]
MLGYVTLGTNQKDKACAFYDELMGSIGFSRIFEDDKLVIWGKDMNQGAVGLTTPFNDEPATVGNGVMVAMQMKSTDEVDAFYNKALALGATDEGAPGQRIEGFYAGYFRDLDGNKFNAFVLG